MIPPGRAVGEDDEPVGFAPKVPLESKVGLGNPTCRCLVKPSHFLIQNHHSLSTSFFVGILPRSNCRLTYDGQFVALLKYDDKQAYLLSWLEVDPENWTGG